MEIIDAQIHPFPTNVERWSRRSPISKLGDIEPETLVAVSAACSLTAMDAVGVDGAIVVSLTNDLVALGDYVAQSPERLAGVLALHPPPLDRPADEVVREIRATPGVVGLRLLPSHPRDDSQIDLFLSGRFEPLFDAAERQHLPIFLLMHGHLGKLQNMLRSHPTLTIIIDHLGLPIPPISDRPPVEELLRCLPEVLELAAFPNVVMKLTSAPALSGSAYPYSDVWPVARQIIDAFGASRVMWGSDFTRVSTLHSYRESVDFIALSDFVSDAERAQLCHGTLRRYLNWPGPSTREPPG
jgi:predicted TIM-barrel fold metal-dependent hydrolase